MDYPFRTVWVYYLWLWFRNVTGSPDNSILSLERCSTEHTEEPMCSSVFKEEVWNYLEIITHEIPFVTIQ